ncbi:hypothetical protein QBC46DRAFT_68441 [Diplogelasinospora grovesii]|uniref:SsuA/THI5-like domain-containing protein n=1 Tax=Diplogelasinospora grovesii TaxID=303347 RepID=A0AAN6MWM7_9PEZI|nr:hypothetical protein QBC46DRAFT_68441 [Diplogelasinospora grovesii]
MRTVLLTAVFTALALPAFAALKIASALNTIEYTPELIASKDYFSGTVSITNGGVANIVSDTSIDLAANAETQALRQFANHKNLRIIYTVAEVYYRLVAAKKSGISALADLKGKKIGSFPGTSAAYFVERLLTSAGLKNTDYTVVSGNICSGAPCGAGTFPYMLQHGTVDAVGMWEPSVQLAIDALGKENVVIFQNRTVYREVFNLHSTAEKLQDASKRKEIVGFLQALIKAEQKFVQDPASVYPRVSAAVNVDTTVLEEVWPVHGWNTGTLPDDLLDVLVAEDQWVARTDRRTAMARDTLANLIDGSVLKEALAT